MQKIGTLRPDMKCPGYIATLAQASLKAPLMGRCSVARRLIAGQPRDLISTECTNLMRFDLGGCPRISASDPLSFSYACGSYSQMANILDVILLGKARIASPEV